MTKDLRDTRLPMNRASNFNCTLISPLSSAQLHLCHFHLLLHNTVDDGIVDVARAAIYNMATEAASLLSPLFAWYNAVNHEVPNPYLVSQLHHLNRQEHNNLCGIGRSFPHSSSSTLLCRPLGCLGSQNHYSSRPLSALRPLQTTSRLRSPEFTHAQCLLSGRFDAHHTLDVSSSKTK